MKIRNGFVSNSSSSAFILLVKKEAYDEAFAKMDAAQQDYCKTFFEPLELFGMQLMKMAEADDLGGDHLDHWDPKTAEGRNLLASPKYTEPDDDEYAKANLAESICFPRGTYWRTSIGRG